MSSTTFRPVAGNQAGPDAGARPAAWALLALTVLALPGSLLVAEGRGRTALTVGALLFLAVAALDAVVGWGLWRLTAGGAPRTAMGTLVTRVIAAAILAAAAVHLLAVGDAAAFHRIWDISLIVFGLHLLCACAAVRIARRAPLVVWLATAAAGVAYLLDALPSGARVVDTAVLMPFMFGELLLLGWLFVIARRARQHRSDTPAPA